ncbi:hypothetical protein [Deinococcus arenicola]|uniref:Uncharacterized protein n=1 Tax=Deinococcus arenicola TaxID=2994950 RepID=A0ABU4DPX5_9DEIO|nr:hypothetical protein [Deinococcus sp. ZS9-10]MDV6373759.1 hypothetical protein [Deinococcus sp. ZS9-10]
MENVSALLIVKTKGSSSWKGLGTKQFRMMPRIGEFIEMNDDAGIGQAYRGVGILHPTEIASNMGDVLVVYECDSTELRQRLLNS